MPRRGRKPKLKAAVPVARNVDLVNTKHGWVFERFPGPYISDVAYPSRPHAMGSWYADTITWIPKFKTKPTAGTDELARIQVQPSIRAAFAEMSLNTGKSVAELRREAYQKFLFNGRPEVQFEWLPR